MGRLTLTDAARINPLELGPAMGAAEPDAPPPRPARQRRAARPTRRPPTGPPAASSPDQPDIPLATLSANRPGDQPVNGADRPRQTSLRLPGALLARLLELSDAGGATVTANALTVAVLNHHLPSDHRAAVELVAAHLAEQLRAGSRPTEEINFRLPIILRTRLDELARHLKHDLPRASRSALIGAILSRHLPAEPEAAAAAVLDYRLAQLPGHHHAKSDPAARSQESGGQP